MTDHTPTPLPEDPVLRLGPNGEVGIIAALIHAMKLVGAVGKDSKHSGTDGEGSTGKWSYRSADAVVTAAGPAMADAGVLCIPNVISDTPFQMGRQDAVRLHMEYRFLAPDGSSLAIRIVSHGVGRTAYTIGAAYSYAFKYALSQALAIPFDDPNMDMESSETGRHMTAEANREWWDLAGWPNAEAHGLRRQALARRLQELPPEHLRTAKRWLSEQSTYQVFNTEGQRAGGIWVPVKQGKPDGPGVLAAGLSIEAMNAADAYVEDLMNTAAMEAAGEEPFDIDPPAHPPAQAVEDNLDGPTVDELLHAAIRKGVTNPTAGLGTQRKQIAAAASKALGQQFANIADLVADAGSATAFYDHLDSLPDLEMAR